MFCVKCGATLAEGSVFCENCGAQQNAHPQQPEAQQPAYQQPAYQQPAYQQPAYQQPAYQQPAYQQPAYQEPTYQQPAYQPSGSAVGTAVKAAKSGVWRNSRQLTTIPTGMP